MGGLHPLCEADRTRQLWRPAAASQRPAPRARRQAAESQGGPARVRRQEGGEPREDSGVPRHIWRGWRRSGTGTGTGRRSNRCNDTYGWYASRRAGAGSCGSAESCDAYVRLRAALSIVLCFMLYEVLYSWTLTSAFLFALVHTQPTMLPLDGCMLCPCAVLWGLRGMWLQ